MTELRNVTHWIDGKPWPGEPARQGDVHDPATGAVQARVDLASEAEVAAAVAAAAAAFPSWRDASLAKRTAVLFAFRGLVAARRDELARLISAEHGKTVADAGGELDRGLEVLELACGIGQFL